MSMTDTWKPPPKLTAAVAVFKELGWDKAELSQALELPLGTPPVPARRER
jgi:hypothetical protein